MRDVHMWRTYPLCFTWKAIATPNYNNIQNIIVDLHCIKAFCSFFLKEVGMGERVVWRRQSGGGGGYGGRGVERLLCGFD